MAYTSEAGDLTMDSVKYLVENTDSIDFVFSGHEHGDVYKRQVVDRPGVHDPQAEAPDLVGKQPQAVQAVSYTHLGGHSRQGHLPGRQRT